MKNIRFDNSLASFSRAGGDESGNGELAPYPGDDDGDD